MNLFDKLFMENAYGVAIRHRGTNGYYITKYPSLFKWYADPFPIHHGSDDYLFAEMMDYHKIYGQIVVARISKGKIKSFKTVIREPFHMSFPNVFEFQGVFYMIPETYQAKQVRLYRCVSFPYQWVLDCVLCEGVELVDHALYISGHSLLMLSYDISNQQQKTVVFTIDLYEKKMKQIYPVGPISQERAGGTIFEIDNVKYRAIQDCVNCYGDFLKIYRIDELSENRIEEHFVKSIHAKDISFSENRGIDHIHTYNVSDTYEAIDFNYRKIYPNKVFIRLWQRVIRKKRRHK